MRKIDLQDEQDYLRYQRNHRMDSQSCESQSSLLRNRTVSIPHEVSGSKIETDAEIIAEDMIDTNRSRFHCMICV